MNKKIVVAGALFSAVLTTTSKADMKIEEVVVTAQKRSQSVQDVPIAMQAFTGDQLNSMGISRASDITKLAPNMNVSGQNAANRQINIRGVGTNDFFGNATGAVGIYMDEVTMSAPYLSGLGLYDMERVEILRGPQNSLFGRNTTGGAVNYISRLPRPGDGTTGFVSATYGNFNRIEIEGALSMDVSDEIAVRIAGKSYQRDGVWNNIGDGGSDWGEKERSSVRATLTWDPSEATRVIANVHTASQDSEYDPVRAIGVRNANGAAEFDPGPVISPLVAGQQIDFGKAYDGYNAQGDNPSTDDWSDVYVSSSNLSKIDADGFYVKLIHEMDWATFSSITSYDETEVKWGYETGGIGLTTDSTVSIIAGDPSPQQSLAIDQDQSYEQFSQEFRLSSPDDVDLKWVAGLYYFSEDSTLSQNARFGIAASPAPGAPPILGGSLGLWALGGNNLPYSEQMGFSIAEIENQVISPYVHLEYSLTDQLNIIVGLRYTFDEKKLPSLLVGNIDTSGFALDTFWSEDLVKQQSASLPLCDFDGDGNPQGGTGDNSNLPCLQDIGGSSETLTFEEVGGKLGLDYTLNDEWMFYGSYSRGFRSGKHDVEFLHGPQTGFPRKDVGVETLDAFEIGFKSTLMEGSMQFNVAAFYYIWNDQQLFFVGAAGPDFANVDESTLMGLDVELKWVPAENWLLQAGLGLLDSQVQESTDSLAATEGRELPFAADTSANLLVIKDIALGDSTLSLQADAQYKSAAKTYAIERDLVDELEETTTVNVRASYLFGEAQQYEVSIFGENLTEEESCQYKWELLTISGSAYCVPNEAEAFYGIQGRVNF